MGRVGAPWRKGRRGAGARSARELQAQGRPPGTTGDSLGTPASCPWAGPTRVHSACVRTETTPLGHQVWGPTRLGSLIQVRRHAGSLKGERLPGEVGGRGGGGPPPATTVGTTAMHVSRLSSTGPHNRPAGGPHLPGGGWARGSRPGCGPAAGAGGSSQASTGRGGPPGWASLSLPGLCTS